MLSVLRKIKIVRARGRFERNALLGQDMFIGPSAGCTNLSGQKGNISIGEHSAVMDSLYVYKTGKIQIGHHFYLGASSLIGAVESITIGNCVIISNDVRIYDNNNHPTNPKDREAMSMSGFFNENWSWAHAEHKSVIIEDNVWIGQYATILKGVTIGKGAIVATRAVVAKDVPPYTVVAGNPARVVKSLPVE